MTQPVTQPPAQSLALPWTADGTLEVLTFGMGSETFAIEAILVHEIVDLLPETAVPGADPMVGHVINFRGRVIPLADLRLAFAMERGEGTRDSRIVVVELPIGDETQLIGVRADRVHEVTTFHADACEAPPTIGMRWPRENVRCLVRRQDDVIVLPDFAGLFHALANPASATIH